MTEALTDILVHWRFWRMSHRCKSRWQWPVEHFLWDWPTPLDQGRQTSRWSMEHLLWDCPPSLVYGTSPVGLPPLSGLWNISCGTAPLQWSMEHLLISCGTAPPQWSVEHLLWDCPPSVVYGTSPVGLPPLTGLWNISCGTAPPQWSLEHLLWDCPPSVVYGTSPDLLWDCPPSVVCGTSPVGLPPFSGLWNISCGTAPLSGPWNISCGTAPLSGPWNISCGTAPLGGLCGTAPPPPPPSPTKIIPCTFRFYFKLFFCLLLCHNCKYKLQENEWQLKMECYLNFYTLSLRILRMSIV